MVTQNSKPANTIRNLAMCIFLIGALDHGIVVGQIIPSVDPMPSHDVVFKLDSGSHFHIGNDRKIVWAETISFEGAHWLRLRFSHLVLAGNPLGGPSSTLRITSLQDGASQLLNDKSARQWRNTSAYFNGDTVKLELIACPNGRMNLVRLAAVTVGEANGGGPNSSICDSNDDRILSADPRVARTIPGGCTTWLFNDRNNCLLTAGHCAASTDVASFNVPLSTGNGNYQFPGPEDQYAVDFSSMQLVNGGVGNDWCYYGCFPNSNTGLTPFQAQGDSFELANPDAVQAGDMIRITGHGTTSFPVDPSWNGAQKTQLGPYSLFTNMQLGYRTDTTGGNSGSPIVFEGTGNAIGIHTHGGCGSSGNGFNQGTGLLNPGLTTALANPLGVCLTTLEFDFPNGLPEFVDSAGGTTILVGIDDSDLPIDPGTATLHVDSGAGFQDFLMTDQGNNNFLAVFPESVCGGTVEYFFSIEGIDGELFVNPINAPTGTYSAISSVGLGKLTFDDDFETDMNWTVEGNATTGTWQRGIPAGGGDRGDPPTDADGSGACYVTGNMDGDDDVDGGTTQLTSPIMNAIGSKDQQAIVSYFRWFDNGGGGDILLVEISNDGGTVWTAIETIGPGGMDTVGGWKLKIFNVADFVVPTSQMRIRFTASDLGGAAIVEAGVDGVSIQLVNCDDNNVLPGDVNLDGVVNLLDVEPFVALLTSGEFQAEADINMDGVVNLQDIQPFVKLLGKG